MTKEKLLSWQLLLESFNYHESSRFVVGCEKPSCATVAVSHTAESWMQCVRESWWDRRTIFLFGSHFSGFSLFTVSVRERQTGNVKRMTHSTVPRAGLKFKHGLHEVGGSRRTITQWFSQIDDYRADTAAKKVNLDTSTTKQPQNVFFVFFFNLIVQVVEEDHKAEWTTSHGLSGDEGVLEGGLSLRLHHGVQGQSCELQTHTHTHIKCCTIHTKHHTAKVEKCLLVVSCQIKLTFWM